MVQETRKRKPREQYSPNVEAHLRDVAKQIAGRSLSEALTSEDSPLRKLLSRVVEVALEEEVTEHLGYEKHKKLRDEEQTRRQNTRNGYSQKQIKTSFGAETIAVPRDRDASFEPYLLPKRGAVSIELEQRALSMYASGMSTRDIQAHFAELYGVDLDSSFVSRCVERLEPELVEWRNRPLESIYALVYMDALYMNVRLNQTLQRTAIYVVTAYGERGVMEVLGLYMAKNNASPKESASFWHQVLIELQQRGLQQPLLVCGDGLTGLDKAIQAVYPQACFQTCVVHLMRNTFKLVSSKDRAELSKALKKIYNAPSFEMAQQEVQTLEEDWGNKYPAVCRQWRDNLEKITNLFRYGQALRKMVYTTNPIENIQRQIRKATKTRSNFPTPESAMNLCTMILRKINEKALLKKPHPQWKTVLAELHLHFSHLLPETWGY